MGILRTSTLLALLLLLGSFQAAKAYSFNGSFGLSLEQRFFEDERFKYVNGFSEYFAPGFALDFGLDEIWYGIEPSISLAFIKNSSIACVVEADSDSCALEDGRRVESEDRFRYKILELAAGFQKYFFRNRYWLQPFVQTALSFRYAWIKKDTFAVNESTKVNGFEFGGRIKAGLFFSFLELSAARKESLSIWGAKDFGLSLYGSYLPSGLFQQGLGMVSSLSGHSFGFSLLVDW